MNDAKTPIAGSVALPPAPACAALDDIALFLDVDGTLVDFAERPDAVVVDAALPALLRTLWRHLDGALALVSGRPLRGIDKLLGLDEVAAAGLHGAELRYPNGRLVLASEESPRMGSLRQQADALAIAHPGILVEHKHDAVALHYRNAPDAGPLVRTEAEALLLQAGPAYELQPGNHVVELKPAAANKGTAVDALMRTPPFAGRAAWVLGDDLTDEHAFACANALGGVSIIVGPRRPTLARHALADPHAVRTWLAELADLHC